MIMVMQVRLSAICSNWPLGSFPKERHPIQTPTHYSPYYLYSQKGSPNFGRPPSWSRTSEDGVNLGYRLRLPASAALLQRKTKREKRTIQSVMTSEPDVWDFPKLQLPSWGSQ